MGDITQFIKSIWGLVSLIATGIGAFFTWRQRKKVQSRKSSQMLYEELERLKLKVIAQVHNEVNQATEIAEKNRLIAELKAHCPECYKSFLKSKG